MNVMLSHQKFAFHCAWWCTLMHAGSQEWTIHQLWICFIVNLSRQTLHRFCYCHFASLVQIVSGARISLPTTISTLISAIMHKALITVTREYLYYTRL
jgi:hypothetical protein